MAYEVITIKDSAGVDRDILVDSVGGDFAQVIKLDFGADGASAPATAATPWPVNLGSNTLANGQVAPTGTAATLLAARTGRQRVTFLNIGTVAVYIGIATVTTANGFKLDPGAGITLHTGALVQAITASGTGAIAYIEEYPA